jgi:hypothetical protein
VSQLANSPVTTFDAEPGKFYLAHWFGISISIFAGQADAAFLRRAGLMNEHWKKHYPTKRTNVTFLLNGVPLPTPEARAAFEVQRRGTMGIVNFGIVVEGDGFWASALRSTITGISLAAYNVSGRTETTIEAIAPWVAREHAVRVGEDLPELEIVRVLRSARYDLAPPLLFQSGVAS